MRKRAPKKTAPGTPGRPAKPDRVETMIRWPKEALAGLDRRAEREGLTRNDAVILAGVAWGEFEGGKPKLDIRRNVPTPPSTASQVETAKRPPETPGSRLDKRASAARSGPKIVKGPVPAAPPSEAI